MICIKEERVILLFYCVYGESTVYKDFSRPPEKRSPFYYFGTALKMRQIAACKRQCRKKQLFVFSTQFSAAFHLLVEKSIYVPTQRQQIKKASSVVYTDTKQ